MTPLDLIELRRLSAIASMMFMITILVIMVRHLVVEIKNRADWRQRLGNRSAIFMIVFLVGEIVSRAWSWFLYSALSRGGDISEFENQYHLGLVSTIIVALGGLGLVYAYSPAKWKHWGWVGSAILAVLTTMALFWFT